MLSLVSERLTNVRWLPWRARHLGGPLNTLVGVHLRRQRLWRIAQRLLGSGQDDVTVVIGTRNRSDYRLRNALASIRSQDHPSSLIRIAVVDYGSDAGHALETSRLCTLHNAQYIRCDGVASWNRSRCLNIGIRQATTKFVLTADTDIIFAPNYLSIAIQRMHHDPLAVLYCQCLDLPEEAEAALIGLPEVLSSSHYAAIRQTTTQRLKDEDSCGICISLTAFLKMVRGYDETFTTWGCEDDDLERRLRYLGLSHVSLFPDSYYVHQWHPKHEGVRGPELEAAIQRNRDYCEQTHSIVRNDEQWGLPRGIKSF